MLAKKENCYVIINNLGRIVDDLYMVGTAAMPVYLLDGERPAIFDIELRIQR